MRRELENFKHSVQLKYNVYNSIFQTLGLDGIYQTGIMLPVFSDYCNKMLTEGKDPRWIVESFFEKNGQLKDDDRINMLFKFIQFIERQVVLVDALEDAAFDKINNLEGAGSIKAFYDTVETREQGQALKSAMKDFKVRTVLTAHPTQFYPGQVLGIIKDLAYAIEENELERIEELLAQLGFTPFFKKQKPTPFDEAVSLIWFLENLFYHAIPEIYKGLSDHLDWDIQDIIPFSRCFQLGFWPGGDRDGNPFVTTAITLQVADRLRESVAKCYYRDIRDLKRKITFQDAEELLTEIEKSVYQIAYKGAAKPADLESEILSKLVEIEKILDDRYGGLHREQVSEFRLKFATFGFHFASIDIRQDNTVVTAAFDELVRLNGFEVDGNLASFTGWTKKATVTKLEDPVLQDTVDSFQTIREITRRNGSLAAHRYIISNSNSARSVGRVFMFARMMNGDGPLDLDIVPLFETIDDLEKAGESMTQLYNDENYMKHLQLRDGKQVVMLGFSDGTKDGGYLTANWSILKAKEMITRVSRDFGIKAVFFDGRGGPPARGGGNTHKFYASLGNVVESNEIQLTIQGQTISSNFGTKQSSRFNLEQLFTAGLENYIFNDDSRNLNPDEREIIEQLSESSKGHYFAFKNHEKFVPYLENISTLKYYNRANIGSRPAKRGVSKELTLKDLRAIPFVGAWSQLKQNVPGFYGFGSALEEFENRGELDRISELYRNSLFFRTLVENSMQSLCKTYFPLTRYLQENKEYGEFWTLIYEEYQRTVRLLLEVSGQSSLLESNPSIKESIGLRERIVLPLLVIQQYALMAIHDMEAGESPTDKKEVYEKLVIRSLYGNINASRNSA